MLKRSLALAAGIALSLSAALAHAETLKELKVSAIPDEAPTELLRKFKPLGAYLEKQLGMPVKFVPVADYAGVVEALAADRLDMAWLGGFTFVQARLKTGNAIPLVQREQDQQFTSKFITADPQVKSLQDLKGKTFAARGVLDLDGISDALYRQIRQLRGDVPRELSPHWQGLSDQRRGLVRIVPWWMVALFTLVCLVVMYSGFAWVLGEQRDTVLQPYQSLDAAAGQPGS